MHRAALVPGALFFLEFQMISGMVRVLKARRHLLSLSVFTFWRASRLQGLETEHQLRWVVLYCVEVGHLEMIRSIPVISRTELFLMLLQHSYVILLALVVHEELSSQALKGCFVLHPSILSMWYAVAEFQRLILLRPLLEMEICLCFLQRVRTLAQWQILVHFRATNLQIDRVWSFDGNLSERLGSISVLIREQLRSHWWSLLLRRRGHRVLVPDQQLLLQQILA